MRASTASPGNGKRGVHAPRAAAARAEDDWLIVLAGDDQSDEPGRAEACFLLNG